MGDNFKAAEFLFKKMKSLYPTFDYPDEFDVELWEEILEGNSQTEILDALKAYRKTVEYNKAPTPAEFRRFLNARSIEDKQSMRNRIFKCADEMGDKFGVEARERYLKVARQQWPDVDLSGHNYTPRAIVRQVEYVDFANKFMAEDIKLGRCRHLLPVYKRAVSYIAEDMLSQEIPTTEWQKMDFAQKCETAYKIGLFSNMDDVLVSMCRKLFDKDYQFEGTIN
jgi:hypothetical protein